MGAPPSQSALDTTTLSDAGAPIQPIEEMVAELDSGMGWFAAAEPRAAEFRYTPEQALEASDAATAPEPDVRWEAGSAEAAFEAYPSAPPTGEPTHDALGSGGIRAEDASSADAEPNTTTSFAGGWEQLAESPPGIDEPSAPLGIDAPSAPLGIDAPSADADSAPGSDEAVRESLVVEIEPALGAHGDGSLPLERAHTPWDEPVEVAPITGAYDLASGDEDLVRFVAASDAHERAAAIMEAVARRVRSGEIVVSIDADASEAMVVASVLTALLRD